MNKSRFGQKGKMKNEPDTTPPNTKSGRIDQSSLTFAANLLALSFAHRGGLFPASSPSPHRSQRTDRRAEALGTADLFPASHSRWALCKNRRCCGNALRKG